MPPITHDILRQSISFDAYLELTRAIVAERVPRKGVYLNDNTFRYTRSNLDRMEKVLNGIDLNRKLYNLLNNLREDWIWVVLSEPWCGDASWGTPAIYIVSTAAEKIEFRILLRDEHSEVMSAYQTEGTDSIPKLICLRKCDLSVVGTWGPRPALLHELVIKNKNNPETDYKTAVRALHAWYEVDMTTAIQEELYDLIKLWMNDEN